MRAVPVLLFGVVAAFLVGSLLGPLRAEEKKPDNKTLIVGAWELTRAPRGGPPVGTTLTFTKDGKVQFSRKANGKELVFGGTYVVEGAKLATILKSGGLTEEQTVTIKKLTDKELVTQDEGGWALEYKRKK